MLTPLFLLFFGMMPQRAGTPTQPNVAVSCQSELRWINNDIKLYSLGSVFQANLFSVVGVGCTPAEIRVSAVFLDSDENVICSGAIENVAQVDQSTQTAILEFKPLVALEFVRWRNGLRPPQPLPKRLICIGPDQLTEVSRLETDRATSLRIFVSLLSRNGGGVSNVEIKIDPRR
jgi:hypothetical protein